MLCDFDLGCLCGWEVGNCLKIIICMENDWFGIRYDLCSFGRICGIFLIGCVFVDFKICGIVGCCCY